jgi:hypothetical protein
LSIGISIAPSREDMKLFLRSLPALFALSVLLFTWMYLAGNTGERFLAVQKALLPAVLKLSSVVTYAFLLTTLGAAVFVIPYLWKKLRGR